MFFKKLFSRKTYLDYESAGDSMLGQKRYADARIEYETALEKLGSEANSEDPDAYSRITGKMSEACLELAKMNLSEARTAFSAGNKERGEEFLELAESFSSDPQIRREISEILKSAKLRSSSVSAAANTSSNYKDAAADSKPADSLNEVEPYPEEEIRFELYISSLPADLPERYRSCGEDFAKACVLSHDGNLSDAFEILKRLISEQKNDLFYYEAAIITAQSGNAQETERLLLNALELRGDNPLACLSLVQLYMSQKRFSESQHILERMLKEGILGSQTLILLGDNYLGTGDIKSAEEYYLRALADKALASTAAQRLIPIMESTGRIKEKEFLVKKHCGKGCC